MTPHFRRAEFGCRCGCGANLIQQSVADQCELIRVALGAPVHVSSGYRCMLHPVERSKAAPGFHARGLAADLCIPRERGWRVLYAIARDIMVKQVDTTHMGAAPTGITGLGIYPEDNFIHVDCRPLKAGAGRATWGRKGGEYISMVTCFDWATRSRR